MGTTILRRNFYVEDILKSLSLIKEPIRNWKNQRSKNGAKREDLTLQKFSSYNLDVLKTIQDKDRMVLKTRSDYWCFNQRQSPWFQMKCRRKHPGVSNQNE